MLMVCGIKFVTESTRFGAFALHLKDSDAVDHLVDCFVIAAKEIAKGEKLFFLLLVDFVLAVKSLIQRRFWLEKTYGYLLYIVKLGFPLYFLLLRTYSLVDIIIIVVASIFYGLCYFI